jgi:hypothetical protein
VEISSAIFSRETVVSATGGTTIGTTGNGM